VDKLFNLNISYACRLFKVRAKVLDILSSGVFIRQRKSRFNKEENTMPLTSFFSIADPIFSERVKNADNNLEMKKKTSLNFRKKTLSLQNVK